MNDLINILKYWHKIEHFSPYELKEFNNENFKRIKGCNEKYYPWKKAEPFERLYIIYMGIFYMDKTISTLEDKVGKITNKPEDNKKISCVCKFTLSNNLKYFDNSFRVSSLPWAVGRIINKGFNPDNWSSDFNEFEINLLNIVKNFDGNWNHESFNDIKKSLKEVLGWDIPLCETWMYIDQRKIDKEKEIKKIIDVRNKEEEKTNEVDYEETEEEIDLEEELLRKNDLLNSFYIRDLEKIIEEVEKENYGTGFSNYILRDSNIRNRIDIENDIKNIKKVLSPKMMPLGRWPSEYNLSLMQQAAVNLSKSEYTESQGIFSINGPPGTGKTTLLRDIIASIIVDRAVKLADYENPYDAFSKEAITITKSDGHSLDLHRIDENLCNYGIVVASNNNGAVQNISKELPGIDAIPVKYTSFDKYSYFTEEAAYIYESPSWALISAVLGSSKNCRKFAELFWDIREKSLGKKKPIRSMKQCLYNKDNSSKKPNWQESIINFKNKYWQVLEEISMLETYEKAINKKPTIEEKIKEIRKELNSKENTFSIIKKNLSNLNKILMLKESELEAIQTLIYENEKRFNILMKILCFFSCSKARTLKMLLDEATDKKNNVLNEISACRTAISQNEAEKIQISEIIDKINPQLNAFEKKLIVLNQCILEGKNKFEINFPDDEYWYDFSNNKNAQIRCPWTSKGINTLREELFLEALELHKSFILNTANYTGENMNLFFNLVNRNLKANDEYLYTNDIIQAFFLVVPIISTTFASLGRLFRNINREQIGWLLIDEAGQGTPQSAAGAIWRAKNTIIVGDPLQIEPIMTIPYDLISKFGECYKIDDKYKESLSIQSFADEINLYGTYRHVNGIKIWIGCPLRVHRRCIEPMFDIFNTIAYDNKMIYASTEPKNDDFTVSKSMWKSIKGTANNPHYVPEQGNYIFELVVKEFLKSKTKVPSLYIITPFTTVKDGLKNLFFKDSRLFNQLCLHKVELKEKTINNWINSYIGTVHTFQGKQADTVIFCLGVDSSQKGHAAISWACSKPNILNVAVSRAKYRFVVVGDEYLWKDVKYFGYCYLKLAETD